MVGRDPHEEHRVATPLELLFDLTFATCFSFAASQFATELAEGRFVAASLGFSFASFAICWAWINFSWFSSAYDTDDWLFRIATMVQMVACWSWRSVCDPCSPPSSAANAWTIQSWCLGT